MTPFLNLVHVGGRGDTLGPVDLILKSMKDEVVVAVVEAVGEPGPGIVNACVSNYEGRRTFYIMKDPGASSLYTVAPEAVGYTVRDGRRWGYMCSPVQEVEVEVTTLHKLYTAGRIPKPHVLSMDAQGSEFFILQGTGPLLTDLVAVITEVEFRPLYREQRLFADIDAFLRAHSFSLYQLYSAGEMYSGELIKGCASLTWAEALYFRDIATCDFGQLLRLLAVSWSFNALSHALTIWNALESRHEGEWKEVLKDPPTWLKELRRNFLDE